jgi:D-alanine--poly(phosphoribitol) ligase subunit 1
MAFLEKILENFERFRERNAFYIKERFFTYGELNDVCLMIVDLITKNISGKQNTVGVITYDDLETYASVLALWITGNIFVPVNPRNPYARNADIIKQAGINTVLASDESASHTYQSGNLKVLKTKNLESGTGVSNKNDQEYKNDRTYKINWESENNKEADNILYLLFTSGSTGKPKGVPISFINLDTFVNDFISYGYKFTPDDRFLQIYDLSFDASVHCYTVPLVIGACIYTVPQDEIKYLYALKLMNSHELTFIKMPPSTLSYLRPYFNKIRLDKMKYCLFGGEALDQKLIADWSECVPNARIQNVYGPTEATINCLIYDWNESRSDKQFNGIISIGKPFGANLALVADNNHQQVKKGAMGELYIGGPQITPGYWNNKEKNNEAFVMLEVDGRLERFYRTGDIAITDSEGDFMFCGRKDEQVQVDGFRVELGEIEHHAREFLKNVNVAATSARSSKLNIEIHLFVEDIDADIPGLKKHLESRLPSYMQPFRIHKIKVFPKSAGGKVNKQELKSLLNSEQ